VKLNTIPRAINAQAPPNTICIGGIISSKSAKIKLNPFTDVPGQGVCRGGAILKALGGQRIGVV
jgi:hypothetical protein